MELRSYELEGREFELQDESDEAITKRGVIAKVTAENNHLIIEPEWIAALCSGNRWVKTDNQPMAFNVIDCRPELLEDGKICFQMSVTSMLTVEPEGVRRLNREDVEGL